jgi:protein SCO1/2
MNNLHFVLIGVFIICLGCNQTPRPLPVLGESEIVDGDTIFHQIPDFSYLNQYGQPFNQDSVKSKVYVSDFFFTKCPTICPKMAQQLLRIHQKFNQNPDFRILSHSIDPKYDSVAALKKYAEKLGVGSSHTWHFLSVPKTEISAIAGEYLAAVQQDSTLEEGFTHTGHFLLIDRDRHIRSFCDGTKPEEVDKLMKEIALLLTENEGR